MSLNINNYFASRRNQFHKTTITRTYRTNPFRNLIPMSPYPMEEGAQPTVVTWTGDLPTAYPTALSAVGLSNGTGNPACNPSATTINNGRIERTYQLYGTAFQTPTFCLSDLKRDWQAAEAAASYEKIMAQYLTVFWSDYYRLQNIAMCDNKVSTHDASVVTPVVAAGGTDFTGVDALPTVDLNWSHLDQLYIDLVRRGVVEEYAIGTDSTGAPVLPIVLGQGLIQKLFRDDGAGTVNSAFDAIKFYNPESLLKVMGLTKAKRGFLPIVDLYPIRFGTAVTGGSVITNVNQLTLANAIYPTVNNGPATAGSRAIPNANYLSQARGGWAQYETATILPNGIYETHYEPIDPTSFAGMNFAPVDYTGEFKFINNKTFQGDNDLGNLGYFRADVRVAAKPLNPDLGVTIITKAQNV